MPGRLHSGEYDKFSAPAIPSSGQAGSSPVPPLYGLRAMKATNTVMVTRTGLIAQVPDGAETSIGWPDGTRFLQCEPSPSGQ